MENKKTFGAYIMRTTKRTWYDAAGACRKAVCNGISCE